MRYKHRNRYKIFLKKNIFKAAFPETIPGKAARRLFHVPAVFFLVFILFFISQPSNARNKKQDVFADSIMQEVINRTRIYSGYIKEYKAEAYLKGTSHIRKKNILLRFAPDFFALNRKHESNILETLIDVQYHAPNNFTQNIKAIHGTSLDIDNIDQIMQFLNINIYNPTSFNDEILMPMASNAFNYYRFTFEGYSESLDYKILKIKVEPKQSNQKLISGYIYIVDKLNIISEVDISGFWDFSSFKVKTKFGLTNEEFLLPLQTNLDFELKVLGNQVINHYFSTYTYTSVIKYEDQNKEKHLGYNLTDYFNVRLDSLPVIKDSVFWENNRPLPLSEYEKEIYLSDNTVPIVNIDSLKQTKKRINWDFTKGIIVPKRFSQGETYFRYSGLLNPFKIGFTGLDGPVYWQQLKLSKRSKHSEKELNFNPEIGFVFKRKEVYFKTPLNWLYNPEHMGSIELALGNRNQAYNSRIIEDILDRDIKDIPINFDSLGLEYYKHYYMSLQNKNELFNGFQLKLGIDYHIYKAVKSKTKSTLRTSIEDEIDILDNYRSFTPSIAFIWTPKQYYKFNGRKKEYLWSDLPTFSFEYARGIPNILGSDNEYERLEADMQQSIQFGLLRSLQYYAGVGKFTNTHSIYFADFHNFAKRNFPQSWDDGIGGVFQLLDGNWYNASDSYLQFHMMYETPVIFLRIFKRATRDIIFKERFYSSQLYTPALPLYTEVGYGIGNFIFNAGIFFSFEKGEYSGLGVKFAFEL